MYGRDGRAPLSVILSGEAGPAGLVPWRRTFLEGAIPPQEGSLDSSVVRSANDLVARDDT